MEIWSNFTRPAGKHYKSVASRSLLGATNDWERQASGARSGASGNIGWTAAREDDAGYLKLATAAASLS